MAKKIQVDLEAKTAKANRDIKKFADKSKSNFDKIKKSSASASKSMMAGWKKAAIAMVGVVVAIKIAQKAFRSFTEVAKIGDDFHKMSLRIGETTETLSALGYVADISGANIQTLEKALKYAAKQVVDFKDGIGEAKRVFEDLGLVVTKTDGSLKKSSTILMEIADKIAQMTNETDKQNIAMRIFGMRAGPELLPMLKLGRKGIKELMEEANKLGITVSTDFANKSAAFIDSLTKWRGAMDGIKRIIVEELLPVITDIVEGMSNWIANNKDLIKQKVPEYINKIGAAIQKIVDIFKALPTGVVSAVGAGIIGRMLFGGKAGAIIAALILINEQVKKFNINISKIPKKEQEWGAIFKGMGSIEGKEAVEFNKKITEDLKKSLTRDLEAIIVLKKEIEKIKQLGWKKLLPWHWGDQPVLAGLITGLKILEKRIIKTKQTLKELQLESQKIKKPEIKLFDWEQFLPKIDLSKIKIDKPKLVEIDVEIIKAMSLAPYEAHEDEIDRMVYDRNMERLAKLKELAAESNRQIAEAMSLAPYEAHEDEIDRMVYDRNMERLAKLKELKEEQMEVYKDIAFTFESSFASAFASFIRGTESMKEAFKSFANSILDDLARILSQKLAAQIFSGMAGWLAGSGGGSAGGMAGAKGGIFPGGFQSFGAGGITNKPTLGLVGEGKYNEAIVPLPNGRSIPVEMSGGGNTYNITIQAVDAHSFAELTRRNPGAIIGPVISQIEKGNRGLRGAVRKC